MQLFCFEHEKRFGKTIEANITELDCTSCKNGSNIVERDCHDKWNLLKNKIDDLYGKGSSNEKFMIIKIVIAFAKLKFGFVQPYFFTNYFFKCTKRFTKFWTRL